jgi:hypothetical protein
MLVLSVKKNERMLLYQRRLALATQAPSLRKSLPINRTNISPVACSSGVEKNSQGGKKKKNCSQKVQNIIVIRTQQASSPCRAHNQAKGKVHIDSNLFILCAIQSCSNLPDVENRDGSLTPSPSRSEEGQQNQKG